ncbi:uncharacterized protein LOC130118302 [Lampris incognitus]|uniref:uncharacterized protein LOC130118302 n=1 Tax=Lampris incognitus TaxID=2546036 RepID=UPI0024B47FEF|nr:uncharacterized protein LOC130118302 [Lampris incognitus]
MSDEGMLEPLVIIEEGDVIGCDSEREMASGEVLTVLINNESSALQMGEKPFGEDKIAGSMPSGTRLEEQRSPKMQTMTEGRQKEVAEEDEVNRDEETTDIEEGQDRGGKDSEEKTEKREKSGETSEEHRTIEQDVDHIHGLASSDQTPKEMQNTLDAQKQVHRLTPDFPEALYELLCTLQEGRRLNDQRCSFHLEGGMTRRRCHSEPNTTKPANRVIFSSMTSLQREEFFDLVATTQARRLDDQRAELQRSLPLKPKTKSFRSSLKQRSIVKKPAPTPVPKEDLYNMILSTQAQGRLEDQRSRAPGPMDDEDFFSLLLRVQGGRMEEQRTELPCILQT